MSQKRHYFLRSFILWGFSFLLAKLLLSGEINLYLAPRLQGLCYVTLAILVLLAFSCLRLAITGARDHDCECGGVHTLPKGFWKATVIYGLFLLPLVMGFFLPSKLLGSAVAEMKGVNLLTGNAKQLLASHPAKPPVVTAQPEKTDTQPSSNQPKNLQSEKPPNKPKSDQEIRKMFDIGFGDFYTDTAVAMYKQEIIKIDDRNFLDSMSILDLYTKEFNGHKVETTGFVYRQPDFQPNEFVAARFSVSCCTADASVTGILIQAPNAKKFANDSWVKVKGRLKLTSFDGNDLLILQADDITPVKPPKTPYVYYNNNNK